MRLQTARDAAAFLVDPTGTTTPENGICADALETHATGVFARLLKHIEPDADIRTFVLLMLTGSPFPPMLVFKSVSLYCSSSSESVMMTRSSAYRFPQGYPVRNSLERASRSTMNSKGLKQEPLWTPTFTLNCSLRLQPTRTLLLAFSYMLCMSRTSRSSMPSLGRAHQMARLGTQWNA